MQTRYRYSRTRMFLTKDIQIPIFISCSYNITLGCQIKLWSANFIDFHLTQQSSLYVCFPFRHHGASMINVFYKPALQRRAQFERDLSETVETLIKERNVPRVTAKKTFFLELT